jgi:hypothetical protein
VDGLRSVKPEWFASDRAYVVPDLFRDSLH